MKDRHVLTTMTLAIACAALAPLTGCDRPESGGGGPAATSSSTAGGGGSPAPSQLPPSGKVYKLTLDEFITKFKELTKDGVVDPNREEARGHFEFAGVVDRVERNVTGEPNVLIRPESDTATTEARASGRACVAAYTTDPQPWAKLARGQKLTVRGRLGAVPVMPNVEQAEIVEAGPPTAVHVTAAVLASAHARGADALKASYAGKDVVVTGKVAAVETSFTGGVTVVLDGSAEVRVRCDLGMSEKDRLGEAGLPKVGDAVKVFGEVQPLNLRADSLPLIGCYLITK